MSERCKHNSYWTSLYGRCMVCRAEQAEARVAALEEALQNYGHHTMRCSAWGPGPAHRPCTCGLDAALARPTPTPDQRQYGKKCAHDGYVVAGCRDCEARATTPTREGEQG